MFTLHYLEKSKMATKNDNIRYCTKSMMADAEKVYIDLYIYS